MKDVHEKQPICPQCGQPHPAAPAVCPGCAGAAEPTQSLPASVSEWARNRDSLKMKWVASVLAFWVSAAVLGVVSVLDGRLNLVLTSIALGMLVLGLWLKTRYQLHLRKDPGGH